MRTKPPVFTLKGPFGGLFVFLANLPISWVVGFCLLLYSFLYGFASPPWAAAHREALAFAAVLTWWGAIAFRRGVQVRMNAFAFALLGIALLVAWQYFDGKIVFGGDALLLVLYFVLCIASMLLTQIPSEEAEWPVALAFVLLTAAMVSALFALTQALGVWADSGWIVGVTDFRRPSANLGQPNQLGTLLVMGAASLIYLAYRWNISQPLIVLASLGLLAGLGITESRTGLLSGLALWLWWWVRRAAITPAVRWPWVVAGVFSLVAVMWIWPLLIVLFQEGGYPSQQGLHINTVVGSRLELWQQLLEAISRKPWFGWGLRGTSAAHNAVVHNYALSEPLSYAHNIVLDMAIGMGFPLTIFVTFALCVWGWRRAAQAHTARAWYAIGILIPFGIHSLLEYPFAYAHFLVPVFLAVGLLERAYASNPGVAIPRKLWAGSFVVFAGLLTSVGLEYIAAEEDFRVARFTSVHVGTTAADYERPQLILLTQLSALLSAARMDPTPLMSGADIELIRNAALRFPWAPIQARYALTLALNGSQDESIRQLKVMRAMHGERTYAGIKNTWQELAHTKYPQLLSFPMP